MSSAKLLERELWLLAMCWRAGWPIPWRLVHRWIEYLTRISPIGARA